jgi:transposase
VGRRTFSQEFKLEAVRAVRKRGLPVAQIARELEIHENLLRKWVRTEEGIPSVRTSSKAQPSEADVARLQRELKKVTMERDILKKALGYFAQDPK